MKIISFLAILFMLLAVACGCSRESGDETESHEKAAVSKAPKNEAVSSDIETADRAPGKEGKLSADTLILTVNDAPVKWPEFHFWLNYIAKYYKSALGIEEITDWETNQNGMRLGDFFLATAVGYACKDRAIEAKAEELGIGLSDNDRAEIEEKRTSNIRIYGSELEYRRIVSSMYISEEVFNYLTKIDYLGNYLFEHFYGANGEKFSDRDVTAYIEESGLMCAKYIFRSNLDVDGNLPDAEKIAENDKLMKELLDRLDASDAPLPLFAELMNEYGEDKAVSGYPNGRLFAPDGKGQAFETACKKLKENEYSGIVTDDKGCYIILRMPIFPDMAADASGNTLRYRAAYELFKKQVEDWSAKMNVEYRDAYYHINVETFL